MRDLREVLEAMLDGVIVLDAALRVEHLNAEACRMFETSNEAARGEPLERIASEPGFAAIARTVLESGRGAVQDERSLPRRGAAPLVVDVAAAPLWDAARAPDGVVLSVRDRTIHHSLAERVTERERLAVYATIAAGIAHEVKNPLGGIRGAAEILGARLEDGKLRDAAGLIVREVDRIRLLVDDLMIFDQGQALGRAPLNIHRVLDEVLDLLSMDPLAKGVALERHFDPSIPELSADADRLTQVFLNLGRNALQALDGRGTLQVETRVAIDQRLSAPDGASRPTLQITVADDGPGIEPEVLEQLSTPFFTTRFGGTGLGLAVSRHWIALHGGTLRIESEPGHGTRARVALPLGGGGPTVDGEEDR